MSLTIEEQNERLKNNIVEMEAQRDALGDTVVQILVESRREKLAELNRLLEFSKSNPPGKPTPQRKLVLI